MADNRLQIIAELIDKVSPAAKKMEQAFKNLQNATGKQLPEAFRKYQNAINANEKALQNYGRGSERVRRELRAFQETIQRVSPTLGRLTESIGSFSTGTGAAITAVAAVGAALVVAGKSAADFAGRMREIKFGSAESGLGVLQIKQIGQALEEYNISQEETIAGFKGLRAAMTDARGNIGKFADSIVKELGPAGLQMAAPVIELIRAGRSTAEVFSAIEDQVDKIKKMFPGAKGEDLAGRFVQQFGFSAKFARPGGEGLREKLEVQKRLGSTPGEMKEAVEQAELLRQKLFEGKVVLDKWKLLLGTDITKAFLAINRLLDSLDEKYNRFMGGNVLRKLLGPNTYDQMFPPTFNERFTGEAAPSAGGAGAPGGGGGAGVGGGTTSGGGVTPAPGSTGGSGGATPFSNRFDTWSPAAVSGHAGHIPSGATGPLGSTRTGGPNIGGPPSGAAAPGIEGAAAGDTGYTGVGGYNFMGGPMAKALGMGDVGPNQVQKFATGIKSGGPASITANKYAGPDIAGFLSDLHEAGAPLNNFAGVYAGKRLGRGWSQHAYGNAVDLETGFGSGPDNSPALYAWSQAHPKEFAEIQAAHHMRNLDTSSGAGMHDWGHFEWSPTGRALAAGAAQARVSMNAGMSGAPATVSGTGRVDVNVSAAVGKTARSQGLFRNINQQRNIQMQPANSGVEQSAPSLAGVM